MDRNRGKTRGKEGQKENDKEIAEKIERERERERESGWLFFTFKCTTAYSMSAPVPEYLV